jgi:hypothetical protein
VEDACNKPVAASHESPSLGVEVDPPKTKKRTWILSGKTSFVKANTRVFPTSPGINSKVNLRKISITLIDLDLQKSETKAQACVIAFIDKERDHSLQKAILLLR